MTERLKFAGIQVRLVLLGKQMHKDRPTTASGQEDGPLTIVRTAFFPNPATKIGTLAEQYLGRCQAQQPLGDPRSMGQLLEAAGLEHLW